MQPLNLDQKIDETRNYILEKIKHNELISKKHKKTHENLNYADHFLNLASMVTGCVSIPAFTSFFDIPTGITSSAATTNICVITAGIEQYK